MPKASGIHWVTGIRNPLCGIHDRRGFLFIGRVLGQLCTVYDVEGVKQVLSTENQIYVTLYKLFELGVVADVSRQNVLPIHFNEK